MRKVLVIGNPGIGSTVAKSIAEKEKISIIMDKKVITKTMEMEAIMYNSQKMAEFDYIPEEKPSFGKSKKQMRNNRNPQRIKAKYKGKSNPFNKK